MIQQRRYDILSDFQKVYHFLQETYDFETLNSYLLPQYWEYAHYLKWFDQMRPHRMGLWEENDKLIGVAVYEMEIGKSHLHTRKGYERLLPEMLEWAEAELYTKKQNDSPDQVGENVTVSGIWITSKEPNKRELLASRGYELVWQDSIKIVFYDEPFVESKLPEGFYLIDGWQVDYKKLADCFWRGFENGEDPEEGAPEEATEWNMKLANASRNDKNLTTIVVAPNGEYACALGMWYDPVNKYAYLEPLATVPKYRRMGLAKHALVTAMEKTKKLGATYCETGGGVFYDSVNAKHVCNRELWERRW